MSQFRFERIVVPIDFSADADAALRRTVDSATDETEIHAIHVLADLPMSEPGVMWEQTDAESRAVHVREAFAKRYPEPAFARVKLEIAAGDPGSQIAEFADRIGADLIVLSSHGHTGIKRLFLGSVAERIVRLAHCACLVLRH